MKKKYLLRLASCILAVLLVFTVVGCGKKTPASTNNGDSSSKEPVSLKFLHIWPEHQAVMEKSIKLIEQKYNLKIEISVVPWDKIVSTVQTAVASGDAPDVALMWPTSMASFSTIGAALDLTPYLDKDTAWKDSFLSQSELVPGSVNGKVYNIPFRGTGTYIVYNKDIFDKNGYKEPANVEELEKMMDDMLTKKVQPFAIAGKPDGFQLAAVEGYFIQDYALNAGLYEDKDYLTQRKVDVKGPYAQAMAKTKDWLKKGYFGANPIALAREEAQSVFFTGKAAMLFCNNNELQDLRKQAGDKFKLGFMTFPQLSNVKEKVVPGGFDGFFVYGKTKHPEESVEILKGLTSPEVQSMWAKDAMSAMVVKGVTYEDKDLEKMAGYLQYAGKYSIIADYNKGDLDTKISQAFVEYLMKDSITADQAEATRNELTKKAIEDAE